MGILKENKDFLINYFNSSIGRFRKVSAIQDIEGKTREVAILDYWSQTALRPLHKYLFKVLRKIPQDCTFNQGSFIDKLKGYDPKNNYYSFDLSKATDRFPMRIINQLLKERFPEEFVYHWNNIMVGYPFDVHKGKISYNCGNPMGAYSSWNSFALTHHYVVYYCCRELGRDWSKLDYVLLGDDIVIHDNDIAQKYLEIIQGLGIEISIPKSYISPYCYEFAKRFVYNGIELTPFPIASLYEGRRDAVMQLSSFWNEVRGKRWAPNLDPPTLIAELWRFHKHPRRVISKMKEKLFITFNVMEALKSPDSAEQYIVPILETVWNKEFVQKLRDEGRDMFYMSRSILGESMAHSFSESFSDDKNGKSLGALALDFVINVTGQLEWEPASDVIQSLPFTQIHGRVEELYLETTKKAFEIDTLGMGDWELSMRALLLPRSDEMYYIRTQDIMMKASSKVGSRLRDQLKLLWRYPNMI